MLVTIRKTLVTLQPNWERDIFKRRVHGWKNAATFDSEIVGAQGHPAWSRSRDLVKGCSTVAEFARPTGSRPKH